MPRNGAGTYSLPSSYLAVNATTATVDQHNEPLEDLQTDANAARPIAAGGTGATSASGARTALGLEIGADVQAYDANLPTWPASVSATEVGYLNGVEGPIQTQIEVATLNAQTGTAYTLAIGDRGQPVTMDNASANTVTIPTNASVAFDVGSVVTVIQIGAGLTTVEGDTGVTVNGTSGGSVDTQGQYSALSLVKVATDTWIALGAA